MRAGPERQRNIPPGESIKVWESPDSLQLPWNDVLSPHPPPETPYRGKEKHIWPSFNLFNKPIFVVEAGSFKF